MMNQTHPVHSRVFGVLVTFRRPDGLELSLRRLLQQSKQLVRLVVIDNSPSPESRSVIASYSESLPIEHVESAENLGPAGGIARGMNCILESADDNDWIVTLDDDDPLWDAAVLGTLNATAERMLQTDSRTGCVGTGGGFVDWRTGRIVIASDEALEAGTRVDYIGGNRFPMYLARVVRAVGTFDSALFWGFDDLEYGLRLRRAGYRIYIDQQLRRQRRVADGEGILHDTVSRGTTPMWRRYYGYRNLIHIFRLYGGRQAAGWVTIRALGKPITELLKSRGRALEMLAMTRGACADGWSDRLGRSVEPDGVDVRRNGG